MKVPMDDTPGVAQGFGDPSSCRCRARKGGRRSFHCSGKSAMGEGRRRSTRCATFPGVKAEETDRSPAPALSPKRSVELDFWDGEERPKKRLSIGPSEGHSLLEVALEMELPEQLPHPTYA